MDKFLYYNDLFNIYKSLLTVKEEQIFADYYEENLSLGEIAQNKNITRSAVGKTVKTVEQKLNKYEESLQIWHKNQELQAIIATLDDAVLKNRLENLLK